ncbi:MAG: hypothetical protein WCY29_03785 [Novosphingobium sp.]
MARIVALARAARTARHAEALRALVVCGCALALILAGRALPL